MKDTATLMDNKSIPVNTVITNDQFKGLKMLAALKACYNLFEAEYEDLSDQGKRVRKQVIEAIQESTE